MHKHTHRSHNHPSHHGDNAAAHTHAHTHAPRDFSRSFLIGIVLNAGFVVAEAAYGVLANSLALLADAGHNLSDVLGLLLAWGASVLSRRTPSARFTYGLRSTSILAALVNAALLLVVTGGIAWEAISRLSRPAPIQGGIVIAVAALGVAVNTATALLFMSGRKGDLNVRGAFLHMAADAAITLGVVVAGVIMLRTGWNWLDPAVSLLIALLVIAGTWGLLRDSLNLALHAVPPGIDISRVRAYLESVHGVTQVHDLHIWGMSTTETALTAHLVFPGGYPGDACRDRIAHDLRDHFGICHATIQIEIGDGSHGCELAPEHVV